MGSGRLDDFVKVPGFGREAVERGQRRGGHGTKTKSRSIRNHREAYDTCDRHGKPESANILGRKKKRKKLLHECVE